jgi:hypothetical protein
VGITFRLAKRAPVRVQILGWASGRVVRELEAAGEAGDVLACGDHTVRWDGRDSQGHPAPAGSYVAVVMARTGVNAERLAALVEEVTPDRLPGGPGNTVPATVVAAPAVAPSTAATVATTAPPGTQPGQPSHDNGVDNGKNPKDFEREDNPGEHKGAKP